MTGATVRHLYWRQVRRRRAGAWGVWLKAWRLYA